tara:strand:+ start:277 stop:429 length:153 start_codon:yes stop_codon:yes gene_type:complete
MNKRQEIFSAQGKQQNDPSISLGKRRRVFAAQYCCQSGSTQQPNAIEADA